ncbi:hypothetical protein BYT27DRAFT_7223991 [Phlegmacium glaucopus]|nr:hypothetical protein BYT27DRAFT_7223991 [Phlegmacium glaucopus]
MSSVKRLSGHSHRETWTCECLLRERAIAIACAVEPSSISSYSSAVSSYFDFCSTHSFPIEPTPNTLSFYAVYMLHHIKPRSVASYLSGVCNQLEPFFPDVRMHRRHWLVSKTLEGCRKMFPSATSRKRPLTRLELANVCRYYKSSSSFNNTLFLAILFTGFHGLQDYRKIIMRSTVQINPKSFQFLLPGHKADRFFEGSQVIIQATDLDDDAWAPFSSYLALHNQLFPLRAELLLKEDGTVPTRSWFLHLLQKHFPGNVGGHSLRAGGATALAEAGLPPHIIQAIGRWSSPAFQIYIRRHPVLLASLLYGSGSPH